MSPLISCFVFSPRLLERSSLGLWPGSCPFPLPCPHSVESMAPSSPLPGECLPGPFRATFLSTLLCVFDGLVCHQGSMRPPELWLCGSMHVSVGAKGVLLLWGVTYDRGRARKLTLLWKKQSCDRQQDSILATFLESLLPFVWPWATTSKKETLL